MMPFFTTRTAAVACAAIVTIPATVFLVRAVTRRKEHPASSFVNVPVGQWSMQQVAQWLQSLGVSAEALRLFKRNEVDGSVLLLMNEEEHITMLAPRLRDRILILEGLRNLREQTTHCVALKEPPVTLEPPTVSPGEHRVAAFLEGVKAIRLMLVSKEFQEASSVIQRERLRESIESFKGLLDSFQDFAPEVQARLLPFVKEIGALINQSQRNDISVGSSDISGLEAQLQPLHEMLDGFLQALDSANINGTSDSLAALLRDKVKSQIDHAIQIACSLPPEYGEPLQKKCNLVLGKIQGLSTASASAASASAGAVPESLGSRSVLVAPVVKQLRDIFDFLKSAELLRMNPEERLARFAAMLKDVEGIKREAESWNDARAAQVVNDVVVNVISALGQMESITREELTSDRAVIAEENNDNLGAEVELPRILASLKAIVQVLYSDELLRAPKEVQRRMQSRLQQSLRRLHQQVISFPLNQNTATVISMIEKTKESVDSLIEEEQGVVKETRKEQKKDNDGHAGGNTAERPANSWVNPLDGILQENVLDEAAGEIEKMFEHIRSDEFETLTSTVKSELAQKYFSRLSEIEKRCVHLEGFDQLRGLIDPMKGILRAELNDEGKGEHRDSSISSSTSFANVLSQLRRWRDFISSNDFEGTDRSEKESFARLIIPQLQKIMTILPRFSPQERVMVEEVIIPINEWLQSIALRAESASAYAGDRQHVVEQMEGILEVLQSEEFRTASLRNRQLIVNRLLQVLQGLEEECTKIGVAAAPLLPILHRLESQLRAFVQPDETSDATSDRVECRTAGALNAEGEGDPNVVNDADKSGNDEMPLSKEDQTRRGIIIEERQKLFKAVEDITKELSDNNNRNVLLSEEEVQPLRGLLDMVDSVGFATAHEKGLRDEFEAQIRRASGEHNGAAQMAGGRDVENLIRTFTLLRDRLSASQSLSPAELVSVMTAVEEALSFADQQNMPWRHYSKAVNLIGEVLSCIQKAQEELCGGTPTGLGTVISEAMRELSNSPPQNKEQLQPYTEVLSKLSNQTGDMSISELEIFKDYQEAVLKATQSLNVNQKEEEDGEMESGETYVARLLLGMSDQLRDGPISDEDLDRYSALLDRVESSLTGLSGLGAVQSVREQVNLQRNFNRDVTQEDEEEGDEEAETTEDVEMGAKVKVEAQRSTAEDPASRKEEEGQAGALSESTEAVDGKNDLSTFPGDINDNVDQMGAEIISEGTTPGLFSEQLE